MADLERPPTDAEIGSLCRCMVCCCPPGRGHNHPRIEEWWRARDRAEHAGPDIRLR